MMEIVKKIDTNADGLLSAGNFMSLSTFGKKAKMNTLSLPVFYPQRRSRYGFSTSTGNMLWMMQRSGSLNLTPTKTAL